MKVTSLMATGLSLFMAGAAFAQTKPVPPSVPEIGVTGSLAALAVVGAGLALVRQRSKR